MKELLKLPLHYKTLKEVSNWIKIHKPQTITIRPNCEIKRIREFNNYYPEFVWNTYQGIPITYLTK